MPFEDSDSQVRGSHARHARIDDEQQYVQQSVQQPVQPAYRQPASQSYGRQGQQARVQGGSRTGASHAAQPNQTGQAAQQQYRARTSANDYSFDMFSGNAAHHHDGLRRVRKKRHRGRKVLAAVAIVLAVVIVGCGAFGAGLALSAKDLKSQATTAISQVDAVQDAISAGDYDKAASSATSLQDSAAALNEGLSSPLWDAASVLPFVGNDVKGVQTLASVLDDVSTNALVPLTSALQATPPSSLVGTDGSLDVDSISTLLATIQEAAPAMERCSEQLDTIGTMNISQLQDVVEPAVEKFQSINSTFQQANTFAPVIADVLGANGDRTYLITAQNSAELRASGGFPGSVGTVTISDGAITLGEFHTVYDMFQQDIPSSVSSNDAEETMFSYFLTNTWDYCCNPDFERAASVWAASYEGYSGTHLDGVISMTPSIVQDLLGVVGSVTLSDGTELTGDNATKVLQHDLYWEYLSTDTASSENNDLTDALFAEAAQLSFDKLFANMNSNTLTELATVVASNMEDRRLMLWLSDEAEEEQIRGLGASGSLTSESDSAANLLGVFVNIWIPSKMGWYLDIETTVGDPVQGSDGSYVYQVETKITNNCTIGDAASGGSYITGDPNRLGTACLDAYTYLYAPAGGEITGLHASNGEEFAETTYNGLQAFYTPNKTDEQMRAVVLEPGETVTLSYSVVTAPGVDAGLEVQTTPTLTEYR